MTLVVGVLGVAWPDFADKAAPAFKAHLADVFHAIDAACEAEAARATGFYEPVRTGQEKSYRIRLLSSYADGAIRFAVENAPGHWEQEALLPLPSASFSGAFGEFDEARQRAFEAFVRDKAGERQVVLPLEPHRGGRPVSFVERTARARHGAFLLRQTDLLIAVFDDEDEGGDLGESVDKALERRTPVLMLSPRTDRAPRLLTSGVDLLPGAGRADARKGPLQDAIARILAPPHSGPGRDESAFPARARLREYLNESRGGAHHWFVYRWLRDGVGSMRVAASDKDEVRAEWGQFAARAFPFRGDGGGDALAARLMTILQPRFYAADVIASYYSHAYRSAYLLAFGLSFGATVVAVLSGQTLPLYVSHLLESVFLGIVFAVVYFGTTGNWHQRWLDARMLAESLRHVRFLSLIGETDLARGLADRSPPGAIWTAWYLRATIREVGLPYGTLEASRLRAALLATREYEVEEQIAYNQSNGEKLSALHKTIGGYGDLAYLGSLVVVGLLLIPDAFEWAKPHLPADWLPFEAFIQAMKGGLQRVLQPLALLLPALGATLAGLRYTGDFENFAKRSILTSEALEAITTDYAAALHRLEFDVTAETLSKTAAAMTDDLNTWRSLYGSKRITLPG